MVAVAQLVRALVCGAGSRGVESHQPPNLKELFKQLFFYLLIIFLRAVFNQILLLSPGNDLINLKSLSKTEMVGVVDKSFPSFVYLATS